jgi:Ni/Co efflux regulator RcnB
MRNFIFAIIALCLIVTGSVVSAEDVVTEVVKEGVRGAFNELEKQTIKKYFKENEFVHYAEEDDTESDSHKHKSKEKSKNKGKNKGLPPGIAKNLERGKPLPPGIAKRDLPDDLDSSLPNRHDGYERTVVGNDVVLVEIDTGKIADIITDAVLGI